MRTGTIASVSYTPDLLKGTDQAFAQLVYGELQKVADAIRKLADGHLDPSYVAPGKPRNGDIRYADGTSWNPGSGEGFYGYENGAWVKF